MAWVTWMHNSRVGVSTRACTASSVGSTYWRRGRPKAAVLPEPVWAWPITSRPSRSGGMASSWIRLGASYPTPPSASSSGGSRLRSANVVTYLMLRVPARRLVPLGRRRPDPLRSAQDLGLQRRRLAAGLEPGAVDEQPAAGRVLLEGAHAAAERGVGLHGA